jgi:hypothetical protein
MTSRNNGSINKSHSASVRASQNEIRKNTTDQPAVCLNDVSYSQASRVPRNEFFAAAMNLARPPSPDFTLEAPPVMGAEAMS